MKRNVYLAAALMVAGATVLSGCNNKSDATGSTTQANSEAESTKTEGATTQETQAAEDAFADAPKLKFSFADNNASSSDVGKRLAEFCESISAATNGTIQVEYYGDGLLGDEATVVGMLEQGSADMARINLGAIQATVPEMGVLTMPYIYKDGAHCVRVLESEVGQELLERCTAHNMVGLTYMSSPAARGFYSAVPIRGVEDISGKMVRVQDSDVAINMVKALGGVATPIAYADVYQALQTGVVDVAENDPNSYYLSGHYEIAKYFTYDNHQISPGLILMSQKAWDSMSEAQQEAVRQCSVEFVQGFRDFLEGQLDTNRKLCEDAGCEFIEVDTSLWREACESMYESYPEYSEWLEKIFAVE